MTVFQAEQFVAAVMNANDLIYAFGNEEDEQKREQFFSTVKQLRDICSKAGWRGVTNLLDCCQGGHSAGSPGDEILLDRAEHIAEMLHSDAKEHLVVLLDPHANREFNCGSCLLGADVAQKFASAVFDIEEAARCLAFERYTAAVFHLMRVLERGLQVLGKAFGVQPQRPDWQNAIDQIAKEIRSRNGPNGWPNSTDWRADREDYAQMLTSLELLKDAWRNSTAHARSRYAAKDARLIQQQVEAFMMRLAARHSE